LSRTTGYAIRTVRQHKLPLTSRNGRRPSAAVSLFAERRFTEHRIVDPGSAQTGVQPDVEGIDLSCIGVEGAHESASAAAGIELGDKAVLIFRPKKGRLSASSPLGEAILNAEEADEVELPLENRRPREVLIERARR
jgi:hypothetical protein